MKNKKNRDSDKFERKKRKSNIEKYKRETYKIRSSKISTKDIPVSKE